jgi:3-phosphoshikimate 1-carboxyvinyltransferase
MGTPSQPSSSRRQLHPVRRIAGVLRVPGDKSIAHRALLFAALAEGRSLVRGLPSGADVASTRRAIEALGVAVRDRTDGLLVEGRGWGALARDRAAPPLPLDCGNSGTTARLLLGLLAGRPGRFELVGDASLSRRPMGRVTRPLAAFGARVEGGDSLPLRVEGAALRAATVATGVASAQVKSALVLAALQADGESTIGEPEPTRDHTERLLAAMGAAIAPAAGYQGGPACRVAGGCPRLAPLDLTVPGDPSSAAFLVGLACALPGSTLVVREVALNPRRTGALGILQRMGAGLTWTAQAVAPEPVGTIEVSGGRLAGTTIRGQEVVDAIDELPLLAVIAAVAEGPTRIEGAGELRVKESDRIAATAALLRAFGAACEERQDGLVIAGGARLQGTAFDAHGDHRIAMAGAIAAALAAGPSTLTGGEWVTISYPAFFEDLERLAEPA